MNPFDEEFLLSVSADGLSSSDIQRRIKMLTERTQFLFQKNKELEEEVVKLKENKPISKTTKKTKPQDEN